MAGHVLSPQEEVRLLRKVIEGIELAYPSTIWQAHRPSPLQTPQVREELRALMRIKPRLLYLQACGVYSQAVLDSPEKVAREFRLSLESIAQQIHQIEWVRLHRSYLVPAPRVLRIERHGRDYRAYLKSRHHLHSVKVSRAMVARLRQSHPQWFLASEA